VLGTVLGGAGLVLVVVCAWQLSHTFGGVYAASVAGAAVNEMRISADQEWC